MTTFSRRGIHGRVVDELGQRIVGGELAPGAILDTDVLQRQLEVSRTVIRETLRVLSTKGLIDARPHRGTFVRPRSEWNLLDEDIIAWRSSGEPDMQLLQELEEVRQIIEPAGARLAALRGDSNDHDAIEAALKQMRLCTAAHDFEGRIAADLAFHRAIFTAAGNELLERLEQLLLPALRIRDLLAMTHLGGDDFLDAHEKVLNAIRAGKSTQAASTMTVLLRDAAADTTGILRAQQRGAAHADVG